MSNALKTTLVCVAAVLFVALSTVAIVWLMDGYSAP